ncbi:lysophospholipid acyltransferase family protein [Bacillus sp. 31A1R]|uniref:1-acyl-sn-glycerol-3-phosphate acyltransferase n=1 Tax=Robertmurraya mangrovi TaxID=3098077 RepID=A0ABU5J134_9BACI|nr:lysophospholipid acyltransferase family protein [Bacillus sp. 31A1R]MDZ5473133.1 lysophospholipid acyltransferase family protein [Bacillus sp. 31A1R]
MFRLIACFLYMSGYLVYSLPTLAKMKKLNANLPVEEKDKIIHKVPKYWSKTIMKITGSNIRVEGQELIPNGPVVFISNHEGDFDIPTLLGYIDKPFGFISKIEVKKVPIISSWMTVLNCVFLDRKDRRQAIRSIREGVDILKKGHSMVIFPEGTRSKGGPIGEFKSGSFRLAKDAGVPIVPICIEGTSDVFEKNGRMIKPADIKVTILPPIEPNMYKDKDLKEIAVEVRTLIVNTIQEKQKVS